MEIQVLEPILEPYLEKISKVLFEEDKVKV